MDGHRPTRRGHLARQPDRRKRNSIDSVGSGAFAPLDVTWASRAEEPAGRTSPEELIAAAHAACFSMALSHGLARRGTPPERAEDRRTVTFQPGEGITKVALVIARHVPRPRRGRVPRRGRGREGELPRLEGPRRGAGDHLGRFPGVAMWGCPLLYERLTWPEVRRAAAEERVCLIPVATLEDHGPHLPIDTDLRITWRDLPADRGGGARRDRPAADDPPRLLAPPHGLPRPDHDRLGHVHPLLHGRRHVARPPRLPADAVPQRPRLQPEPRRGGGAARRGRPSRGARGGRLLPLRQAARWRASSEMRETRSAAAWATPASSRPRSTWRSTRMRWTWRRRVDERGYPDGRVRLHGLVGRAAEA